MALPSLCLRFSTEAHICQRRKNWRQSTKLQRKEKMANGEREELRIRFPISCLFRFIYLFIYLFIFLVTRNWVIFQAKEWLRRHQDDSEAINRQYHVLYSLLSLYTLSLSLSLSHSFFACTREILTKCFWLTIISNKLDPLYLCLLTTALTSSPTLILPPLHTICNNFNQAFTYTLDARVW